MPRNGSGIYSLPAQYLAETGQTIETVQHNTPLEDIAADLNNARPIVTGGTGEATAVGARQTLGAGATSGIVDKAAGTYTAVKNDYNQFWRATGAVTINLTAAATLKSGWCMWVQADGGAVTIDPNGSEQINEASTFTISRGGWGLIICTGSAFRMLSVGDIDAIKAALTTTPWIPLGTPLATDPDLNTFVTGGFQGRIQLSTDSIPNAPAATGLFYVLVFETSSTRTTQMLFPYSSASQGIWFRTQTTSWSAWERFVRLAEVNTIGGTDVAVADGGTGRSSHTAYAVLCGGTTTTAAQQSIASVGTSGQVLTSNGAGSLPTFQAVPVDYAAGNAALNALGVGTYCLVLKFTTGAWATGGNLAGSSLRVVGVASGGTWTTDQTLSGTWKNMGYGVATGGGPDATIAMRVS